MTWPGKMRLSSGASESPEPVQRGTNTAKTNFGGITEVDAHRLLQKEHVKEFIEAVSSNPEEIKTAAG
jgi:hypothetical protein